MQLRSLPGLKLLKNVMAEREGFEPSVALISTTTV